MSGRLPLVVMPQNVPLAQREAWLLAGRLYKLVPDRWTIIGGQMVQFHGWRTGTVPTRATTDLDAGIAVRAYPKSFHDLSAAIQDLGLRPIPIPAGVEYRWCRTLGDGGQVQVDLLLPSGIGERGQTSVNRRPGVQSRGVQWATDMSQLWRLEVEGRHMVVPVPSLLGAVVAKASALLNASDDNPDRHLSDIRFLAEVATRADLSERLTVRQADRVLHGLDRIDRPGTDVLRLRMAMERILRDQREPK